MQEFRDHDTGGRVPPHLHIPEESSRTGQETDARMKQLMIGI